MFRLIRKTLSIFSLLIALAIAFLWIRSHSKSTETGIYHHKHPNPQHWITKSLRLFIAESHAWIFIESGDIDLTRDLFHAQLIGKGRMRAGFGCYFQQTSLYPRFRPDRPAHPLPAGTFAGFSFSSGPNNLLPPTYVGRWVTGHQTTLTFPLWFPILLFSLPGLIHFRQNRKRTRRLRRGLCPTCGYDLRESKSTCPECGTAPVQSPLSAG